MVSSFGYWERNKWKWNVRLRRECRGWEMDQWNDFQKALTRQNPSQDLVDRMVWKPSKYGNFSVQLAMREMQAIYQTKELMWKMVWKGDAPLKVETFIWQALRGRIPVRQLLCERGLINSEEAICPLCKSNNETAHHILFGCKHTWNIWMKACQAWNIMWVTPGSILSAFTSWTNCSIQPINKTTWRLLFLAILWSTWLCRNQVIFEGKEMEESKVYEISIHRLVSWFRDKNPESLTKAWEVFKDPKILRTQTKRKEAAAGQRTWSKPGKDTMKFNVDAAVANISGAAGI